MELNRLCRCCMKEVAAWERENFSQRAVEMFCFCTDIKIENDILPRQFCYECVVRIESTYTFIIEAQRIDMHYKTILTELNTSGIIENDPYNKNPAFLGYQPNYHKAQINNSPYFKEILENNNDSMDVSNVPSSVLGNDINYQLNSELEIEGTLKSDVIDEEAEKMERLCEKETRDMGKGQQKKKCPKCPKVFAVKAWFVRHLKNEHGRKKTGHICLQCTKSFSNRQLLKQHVTLHSKERLFACDICSKSYKLKKHLTIHMKSHSDARPYICDYCKMSFKLKKILKNHLRVHQMRKFLCSECGLSFVHYGNLSIHMRIHTGDKPHVCPDCGLRFNTTSSLARHKLRHKGQRPFMCALCNKTFTDSSGLSRHKRTHTGELPYRCPHCPLSFLDSWKRKTHLMRTHQLALHQIPKMDKDGIILVK